MKFREATPLDSFLLLSIVQKVLWYRDSIVIVKYLDFSEEISVLEALNLKGGLLKMSVCLHVDSQKSSVHTTKYVLKKSHQTLTLGKIRARYFILGLMRI